MLYYFAIFCWNKIMSVHPNNIFPDENISWKQWKYLYRDRLEHIAGYEERFVDEVLVHVCSPHQVVPQYFFQDSKGGNRYIDFMIRTRDFLDVMIPIELDGYSKMVGYGKTYDENYARFNDFLERQNDLIREFGFVLRFSNKKWQTQTTEVIKEIKSTINQRSVDTYFSDQIKYHVKYSHHFLLIGEKPFRWYNPIHWIKYIYYLIIYFHKGNTFNQLMTNSYTYIRKP